jgi:two-component system response regulator DesR
MRRFLLVEDHAAFRQALSHVIEWKTDLGEGAQASTLSEGRRCFGVLDGSIEVALIDLGLPDGDGVELVEQISQTEPDIPVVVLTESQHQERISAAFGAGADEVLTKDASLEEVLRTLRSLAAAKEQQRRPGRREGASI